MPLKVARAAIPENGDEQHDRFGAMGCMHPSNGSAKAKRQTKGQWIVSAASKAVSQACVQLQVAVLQLDNPINQMTAWHERSYKFQYLDNSAD